MMANLKKKQNKIFINGRFLTRPLAGVQRTAYELTKALDDLLSHDKLSGDYSYIILYSGTVVNPIKLECIKLVKKGFLRGNLWEQLELPVYTAGHLLINMCSIAPILKFKQVVFLHDASFFVNPAFFSASFRVWYKFAIPIIARLCRQIITVSNFSKSELVNYGKIDRKKITVIYNGADHINRFGSPGFAFEEKIKKLKPYCLAVSSLGANKNFEGLSKALAKVKSSRFNMVIAGGAVDILQGTQANTGNIYLGYVSNEELTALYQNASLFLFPSFYEGFGIPPLESMSMGCPVIASHTSAIPEILENSCAYFDPYDVNEMAFKIDSVLNDAHQLERLKTLGYQQAAKFKWRDSALYLRNLIINKYA